MKLGQSHPRSFTLHLFKTKLYRSKTFGSFELHLFSHTHKHSIYLQLPSSLLLCVSIYLPLTPSLRIMVMINSRLCTLDWSKGTVMVGSAERREKLHLTRPSSWNCSSIRLWRQTIVRHSSAPDNCDLWDTRQLPSGCVSHYNYTHTLN